MKLFLILVAIISIVYGEKKKKEKENPLAHGFTDEIDWVEWDRAIGVAKDLNKPIFFLIHKTWCGACKGLKNEFKTSFKTPELIELSKKFVMVNVEDDDEPEDDKYAPDGGYIPRILFLDTDADPLLTNNENNYKNNKYFYPLVPQIIDGMKRALNEFSALNSFELGREAAKDAPTKQKKSHKEETSEEETEAESNKTEEKKKDEKTEKAKDSKKESKTEKKVDTKKKEKEEKKKDKEEKPKKDPKKETKQDKVKEEKATEKDEEKKTAEKDEKKKTDKEKKSLRKMVKKRPSKTKRRRRRQQRRMRRRKPTKRRRKTQKRRRVKMRKKTKRKMSYESKLMDLRSPYGTYGTSCGYNSTVVFIVICFYVFLYFF
ncbi:hypothetical protein RB195_000568 [Necator americanus]|uniref:Thioredoxin domain-containing protein n=1 Tax=Necator americanus TaxID=51031 RepID=A0ABR1DAY0_NECAM